MDALMTSELNNQHGLWTRVQKSDKRVIGVRKVEG